MNNDDLKKLILKIAESRDKSAFSDIFDYFAPRLLGYLVNSGSKIENAEEIVQEVLSSVWLKAFQFDNKKGNVNTWVFRIARNKKIDKIRKNIAQPYDVLDFAGSLYPYENEKQQDLNLRIEEIQLNLNKKEKEMIKMNFFEGKSHKNISQDLEIPLGTVKSRIRNILNKMKQS